ncbi:MAG: glycosyltransferase [Rhodospirillaceae bacterium]|jgi:hypothetical protein|nr:glycosyltransferase [Rhodospirillaceae bacterium]
MPTRRKSLTATDATATAIGKAAFAEWRFDDAEAELRAALAAEPENFEAKAYLARTLDALGKSDDAIALYRKALDVQPDNAATHLLLAQALLTAGHYAEGWDEYEWRYKGESGQPFPNIDAPLWDGEPLDGRTLLVVGEQGFGDVLQFVRLLALVKALGGGGKLSLACSAPLARLLDGVPGVDHLFQDWRRAGAFDCFCPLSSLPRVLGLTADTIPADVPYITADPRQVRRWEKRLGQTDAKRIGLCWAGRPTHPNDRYRSLPFDLLNRALPRGPTYVSLQKGERATDVAGSRVKDLSPRLHDFADTAAVLENLDLVITVDTSIAHLAGAMGKPVWVLVPYVPDWRWGRDEETTPWYPTAHLFRQIAPKDWQSVVAAISDSIDRWLLARPL